MMIVRDKELTWRVLLSYTKLAPPIGRAVFYVRADIARVQIYWILLRIIGE